MKMTKHIVFDLKSVRHRLGMNQQEFWSRIGVAQSCGSRYENGRQMPKPVQELLRVVHIERIDLAKVHAREFAILDYLKTHEPASWQNLCQLVGSRAPQVTVLECRPVQSPPKPQSPPDINTAAGGSGCGASDGLGQTQDSLAWN